ncbi:MAG: endopeptidase La [Clostridia bacterium]|nr:endopeptidase La [Clostridia bacterium]
MDENMQLVPTVALRGLVVFPGMVLHFDAGREKSINAVREAMDTGDDVFLITQKDAAAEDPSFSELYKMGVLAKVRQIIGIPESNSIRVIVEGICRATVKRGVEDDKCLYALVERKLEKGYAKNRREYAEALVRKTHEIFDEYSRYTPRMSPDVMLRVIADDKPGAIADYIASVISIPFTEKQKILDEMHPITRLEKMCETLTSEIQMMELEDKIAAKVEQAVDDNQREYYLREQIRALSEELDGTDSADEIEEYRQKINSIEHISSKSRDKLLKECSRLQKMGNGSPAEATVSRNYLDTVLNLPWDNETKDKLDLKHARKVLDADHYGLTAVKDRIIELLAVRRLNPDVKGQIICLAGPPGVGKTSIAKSLADAMGRSYARVSLGGIHDEAEIRGHRRTYIGSMPGRVMAAIADAGTRNPLILFDEIDKLAADIKGDPASAMLEVLDPEQNKAFVDHFIEIPFDLSNVLFITTANDKGNIPAPLLDRMEVIDLYSYTAEEKFHIAKRHLVPKALAKHGIDKKQLKIADSAINELIASYTREAGVRNLEREINNICRKTALEIVSDKNYSKTVTAKDLKAILGAPKYKEKIKLKDEVGVVNGLAWTAVGGEMLKVETAVMPGKGNVELTGSLGDVMKESAKAAVSFLRANTKKYGIAPDFYKENDIHIHVPEGAVPKDGPSAGVTMATSLLSALTGRKVKGHVAMTGEISLTGNVMPIGGLREKTMAAYKAGITTVIIPKENVPDLDDVVDVVKKNITFIPVTKLDEVFKVALL